VAVRVVWSMLKLCQDREKIPSQWMEGILFPLYKKGDKRDHSNYRGISLLSIVSKLYEAVIYERLDGYCEVEEKIEEEQGGFRKWRGCIDQLYTFDAILRRRKTGTTYCCFIDVRKAFDSVWRTGLWKRLWEIGVKGKLWRILRSIYKEPKSRVRVNGKLSGEFKIGQECCRHCCFRYS